MDHTQNYQLAQWAAEDQIKRTDFNDTFARIDTAVAANAAALSALEDAKASNAALGAEVTARQEAISAEAAARTADLAAVNANLGSHGHNVRIVSGSYTGTGRYGSSNPNSLTFDFIPVLVLIGMSASNGAISMCHLARPNERAASGGAGLSLSWTDHGVSWYNGNSSDSAAEYQLNKSGATYHYLAFGYDGEA